MGIYFVLDIFIILAVLYLFINPIIRLLTDLRTKSEQHIELKTMNENDGVLEHLNEESSSSEFVIESTPHSPTKMGAAYYTSNKNKKMNHFRKQSSTQSIAKSEVAENAKLNGVHQSNTSMINPKLMNCGRLACPEDDINEEEVVENTKFKFKLFTKKKQRDATKWNEKQIYILNKGTRLALLSVIALSSGLIYQFLWIYSIATNKLGNYSYSWSIDTVIGIICIYLSFGFAEIEYNMICAKCCHCHGCCLKIMKGIAKRNQ